MRRCSPALWHDPEKWLPVFQKDHAQTSSQSEMVIQLKIISLWRDKKLFKLSRDWDDFLPWHGNEPGHGAGGDHRAVLRIGLVIALDVIEIVEIIHHQTIGLFECPLRRIGEPIEPLEPRAIAEMESGDRVDRQAAAVAGAQVIPCGRAQERLPPFFRRPPAAPPTPRIHPRHPLP